MRESLVCIGKIAERGYHFEETGVRIFSYEELCYYLREHMVCYLDTLPEPALAVYIRDALGLPQLYRQLIKLTDPEKDQMKYFSVLFRAGNYFNEEEIREILDTYRAMKNAPLYHKKKALGDLYVRVGHAARAAAIYEKLLDEPKLNEEERGTLCHNLGVAHTRLFRFERAKIDFVKAYQYVGDERSLYYYYCIIAVTEGMERADSELASFEVHDLLSAPFREGVMHMKEDFAGSAPALACQKILFQEENGREEEAKKTREHFVRQLQREFRSELC